MKKFYGFVFLIFCVFVLGDYLMNLGGSVFPTAINGGSSTGLSSIDLSLFSEDGIGRSYITQGYGRTSFATAYINDRHNGIDIAAVYGAPIYSPGSGTVLATGNQDNYCSKRGFGKYVAVRDDANQLVLFYAHLGKISISPGDTIQKGTLVGTVGTTGFETGTHLHFSIFDEKGFSMAPRNGCGPDPTGRDLNPLSYLGSTYK